MCPLSNWSLVGDTPTKSNLAIPNPVVNRRWNYQGGPFKCEIPMFAASIRWSNLTGMGISSDSWFEQYIYIYIEFLEPYILGFIPQCCLMLFVWVKSTIPALKTWHPGIRLSNGEPEHLHPAGATRSKDARCDDSDDSCWLRDAMTWEDLCENWFLDTMYIDQD